MRWQTSLIILGILTKFPASPYVYYPKYNTSKFVPSAIGWSGNLLYCRPSSEGRDFLGRMVIILTMTVTFLYLDTEKCLHLLDCDRVIPDAIGRDQKKRWFPSCDYVHHFCTRQRAFVNTGLSSRLQLMYHLSGRSWMAVSISFSELLLSLYTCLGALFLIQAMVLVRKQPESTLYATEWTNFLSHAWMDVLPTSVSCFNKLWTRGIRACHTYVFSLFFNEGENSYS